MATVGGVVETVVKKPKKKGWLLDHGKGLAILANLMSGPAWCEERWPCTMTTAPRPPHLRTIGRCSRWRGHALLGPGAGALLLLLLAAHAAAWVEDARTKIYVQLVET
ncbi:hypothetical protein B566_EDAN000861 [Ephemera danica]|nr:hypothetical protein B566_EDAN000861 [Ephemera danica]